MASKRVNVKAILADADLRRKLMVSTIQATQAREGIDTSPAQADRAYYVVTEAERAAFFDLERFRAAGELPERRHTEFVRALATPQVDVRFDVARRDFANIEGAPLAYQRLPHIAHLFRENNSLDPAYATVKQGMATSADEQFIRYFWEIPTADIGRDRRWAPYAKGGDFCRFYYDVDLVVLWENDGEKLKAFTKEKWGSVSKRIYSQEWYFRPGLTWPRRTQRGFNLRKLPAGCVFSDRGPTIFPDKEADVEFLLGLCNSSLVEYVLNALVSFGSWEVGVIKRIPIANPALEVRDAIGSAASQIYAAKAQWDVGNETSTRFTAPWIVMRGSEGTPATIAQRLEELAHVEAEEEARIQEAYVGLNEAAFKAYGVPAETRAKMERTSGPRPPETLWPSMERLTLQQKRMEHVWRLLSFVVKRVVDADDDGVVPFGRAGGDAPLVERVRQELAALFPDCDENQLCVEIVNELKRGAKGYRKCSSLEDWLADAFFEYHASLYKDRPIYWHIASSQGSTPFAFGALIHYHRFDKNRIAKLRASYVRDTIEEYRREAALADKAGRADDRLELQAKVEEAQALDRKLQQIQEGHHEGSEGGDRDFRIRTPWKAPEDRPKGWNPDLDDGVRVNIAPFDRAGILRVSGVAG